MILKREMSILFIDSIQKNNNNNNYNIFHNNWIDKFLLANH